MTAVTAAMFAAVFVALYVAHRVGDHWVQTSHQSAHKVRPGWVGRLANALDLLCTKSTNVTALRVVCAGR